MEREEEYNTTSARIVKNNSKTNDDQTNFIKKYGVNMFGKDRQPKTLQNHMVKVLIGLEELLIKLKLRNRNKAQFKMLC